MYNEDTGSRRYYGQLELYFREKEDRRGLQEAQGTKCDKRSIRFRIPSRSCVEDTRSGREVIFPRP